MDFTHFYLHLGMHAYNSVALYSSYGNQHYYRADARGHVHVFGSSLLDVQRSHNGTNEWNGCNSHIHTHARTFLCVFLCDGYSIQTFIQNGRLYNCDDSECYVVYLAYCYCCCWLVSCQLQLLLSLLLRRLSHDTTEALTFE